MLLAHQGGWDEMLLVLAPIALIVSLLRLAGNRAKRMAGEPLTGDQGDGDQEADETSEAEAGS